MEIINFIKKQLNIQTDFSIKFFANDLWKYLFENDYKDSRDWYFKWNKVYKPQLKLDNNLKETIKPSSIPIDVLITCLPKDIDILPSTIASVKKNVKHKIDTIYIISPEGTEIEDFCKKNQYKFVNEKGVLGFDKTHIKYEVNGLDRSGWLLQQLLKLSGDVICNNEHFLIIDADTLFIKPRTFKINRKTIIDFSDEYHLPYYKTYEKLLHLKHKSPVSYICHYMLLEKNKLRSLKKHIENIHKCNWYEAILDTIDPLESSSFSEFETYANFVLEKHPKEYVIEYWFNKSLNRMKSDLNKEIISSSNDHYKTLSYHTYSIH